MSLADLTGKTIVVTGGARGIGKAICTSFAQCGGDVIIADIRLPEAQATATELCRTTGRRVVAIQTDLTNLDDVVQMTSQALEQFGKIDVLVNNAGWDKLKPFLKTTPDFWDKVIAINYKGVLNTCFAVLPHMVSRKAGSIVNISSDTGRVGSMGEAVYSGTKGAIIAFSKSLAREHARDNIRVNVVCPGLIDTPLLKEIMGEEFGGKVVDSIVRSIPLRRLGQPDEVSPMAVFLASDSARYITGQLISVNGGLAMAG
ncbi:MAG: SDR family oxidoreductase [Acidobacteria bacterium]|nr:SDR family oxidoreductase [Acidobacteriota bacterium]MBI3655209.1 SDR family oxidoreductase [Acidobacteriota bacterium]